MTITERIKVKCIQLLALAEKRTPGPWQQNTATLPGYIEHFIQIDGANTAIASDILDGYEGTASIQDIALNTDNPAQGAQTEG